MVINGTHSYVKGGRTEIVPTQGKQADLQVNSEFSPQPAEPIPQTGISWFQNAKHFELSHGEAGLNFLPEALCPTLGPKACVQHR